MSSAFAEYLGRISGRKWSQKYWDGRPTGFLSDDVYEEFLLLALDEQATDLLTVILDEVDPELMDDVADRVFSAGSLALLNWYFTTEYPPLLATLTPERLDAIIEDEAVQTALVNNPVLTRSLAQWYRSDARWIPLAEELEYLIESEPVEPVSDFPPSDLYNLSNWRASKKHVFLTAQSAVV